MVCAPPTDEVHVWLTAAEELDEDYLAQLQGWLSPQERERCERYRFAKDRRLSIIARAQVRTLLSRYTGVAEARWQFKENRWGRPEVASPEVAPPLLFNISHTFGLVACIVARDREIGVDVEHTERRTEVTTIAQHVFSRGERDDVGALQGEAQRRRFFEYWTLKESYIKARGMGLALPLDKFTFSVRSKAEGAPDVGFATAPELGDDADSWYFELWRPDETHQAALALRRQGEEPVKVRTRPYLPPLPNAT